MICGVYVDHIGNPITSFSVPVATLYEQENIAYMGIFKKVLSGQIGQTLNPVAFPAESDSLLLRVRDSALKDEKAVEELFTRLIAGVRAEHPDLQSVEDAQNAVNWLILLLHDEMDVRERDTNEEIDRENSFRAFSWFLCAICPVKQDKPALRYWPDDKLFHQRPPEWLACAPALGFVFPLYEGGAADVDTMLFFIRDKNDAHADFLKAAFNVEAEMPAAVQTEAFQTLLAQSLGTMSPSPRAMEAPAFERCLRRSGTGTPPSVRSTAGATMPAEKNCSSTSGFSGVRHSSATTSIGSTIAGWLGRTRYVLPDSRQPRPSTDMAYRRRNIQRPVKHSTLRFVNTNRNGTTANTAAISRRNARGPKSALTSA